ncbi:MAG: HD domain-containing phosphohydrolase [Planctomycetota bacterium]
MTSTSDKHVAALKGAGAAPTALQRAAVLSGTAGAHVTSSQAGFIPVPLARIPLAAMKSIPIYLRSNGRDNFSEDGTRFVLYRSIHTRFSDTDRMRLSEAGVKFVYVPMAEHDKFRRQTEDHLASVAADPKIAQAEAAALVYETSLELVNEVLSEPHLARQLPRLEKVARAVTTLTMKRPDAFEGLFATAHHDFYTATHAVNVATWMVSLAYALGYEDEEKLNLICQAGMLHDIGKIYLPADLLNKTGRLTERDWELVKQHPTLGRKHMQQHGGVDPIIMRVAEEHHERLDGSGYPHGLAGDQIHPLSRICAIVDSFDAMTAFRPYKAKTLTVPQAMQILETETPERYDPTAMAAWLKMMESVQDTPIVVKKEGVASRPGKKKSSKESCQRRFERFQFHCQAKVYVVVVGESGWTVGEPVKVTAHNISRSGLAFLSQVPIHVGSCVRVELMAQGSSKKTLDGRIMRCHAYSDGCFDIGMAITKLEGPEPR